jgi:hypothetical protein
MQQPVKGQIPDVSVAGVFNSCLVEVRIGPVQDEQFLQEISV